MGDNELHLVRNGNDLAIVGGPAAVETFLRGVGAWADSQALDLRKLGPLMQRASDLAKVAAETSAASSRWIKLTEESAKLVAEHDLMDSTTPGVKHIMIGVPGRVSNWLQTDQTTADLIHNPAVLSGVANLMAQSSGQQSLAEIKAYLVRIDEKLDDVRRTQRNQVLAKTDGVYLALREAVSIRDAVGRVSHTTWSKIDATSTTILEVQAHALRELGDLADKLEEKARVGQLADVLTDAKADADLWLSVLARCAELKETISDLEFDRVREESPDELDQHRLGVDAARKDRAMLFAEATMRLLNRMDTAVGKANKRIVWTRTKSLRVITAGNEVAGRVDTFHDLFEIDQPQRSWQARQLSSVADGGSRLLQGSKDAAPTAGAVVGAVALGLAAKKIKDGPSA